LHQSEAEENSRIKRGGVPLVAYTIDHRGIVVNTRLFHELLESVISSYTAKLRDPAAVGEREAFRKKMNFICRIEEKEAEDASAA
jgi:hypothetical protein